MYAINIGTLSRQGCVSLVGPYSAPKRHGSRKLSQLSFSRQPDLISEQEYVHLLLGRFALPSVLGPRKSLLAEGSVWSDPAWRARCTIWLVRIAFRMYVLDGLLRMQGWIGSMVFAIDVASSPGEDPLEYA